MAGTVMNTQKAENLLNLALDATQEEREKSLNLEVGYDPADREWELIIKYDQSTSTLEEYVQVVPLSFGYGIVRIPESRIGWLAGLSEVEYIEKPKRLFFAVDQGKTASCFLGLPPVRQRAEGSVQAGIQADRSEETVAGAQTGRSEETVTGAGAQPDRTEETAAGAGAQPDRSGSETLNREVSLEGQGILVAALDSGVDIFHPDFRNEDGTTRILAIWDQTASGGEPPAGFLQGREFTREQINQALLAGRGAGYQIVPSTDNSGHGTAVLGVAAGNGNASGGRYAGGAPESELLVVKLGTPGERDFPSTTQLMQGLEYVIKKAEEYQLPVAVNLSFGNVYGSHTGTSLLETYLDEMAGVWKNVIVVGSGNEGAGVGHASGVLRTGETQRIELGVAEYESILNLQLWKTYGDEFTVELIHPSGQRIRLQPQAGSAGSAGSVSSAGSVGNAGGVGRAGNVSSAGGVGSVGGVGTMRYRLGQTELLVYYGVPSPYSTDQEIYLDFLPVGDYIDSGIWAIELSPQRIIQGAYDMWLPGGNVLNRGTGFLRSSPETTLTIPSTAGRALTVGAYDSRSMSYAAFSGRGYTRYPRKIKPDLAAPGVDITAPAPGGGYTTVTGTSFAAPFATAAAALLLQWGIRGGNDPYLYGQKVKAYLIKGARQLPGFTQWPNEQVGYGALCVRDSLPI